jgi:hypothetical protein
MAVRDVTVNGYQSQSNDRGGGRRGFSSPWLTPREYGREEEETPP